MERKLPNSFYKISMITVPNQIKPHLKLNLQATSPNEKECNNSQENTCRGAWVAQSVKRPTLAQVIILQSVISSPVSGSVLTARSLEPASDSVSPFLSAPPQLVLSLSLSQKQ